MSKRNRRKSVKYESNIIGSDVRRCDSFGSVVSFFLFLRVLCLRLESVKFSLKFLMTDSFRS